MLGAIAGDIIGSPYRGEAPPGGAYDFPLFTGDSRFAANTVMTVAVAWCLLTGTDYEVALTRYLSYFPGSKQDGLPPDRQGNASTRYGICAPGSPAGAVAPLGLALDTLEEVLEEAGRIAIALCDRDEAVESARAAAAAVFLARKGRSQQEIREFIEENFFCDLNEEPGGGHSGRESEYALSLMVGRAIRSFSEAGDFEDAVRRAVSAGGDGSLTACIAGGVAHPFFGGVPGQIQGEVLDRLDERLITVALKFMDRYLPGWTG